MDLNREIYRQLSTYAGLSALVGTRIYPAGVALQGTLRPYMTYQRITTTPTYAHDGPALAAMGNELVQFDVYADDPDVARSTAVQVKAALDNWSSPAVHRAFIEDDRDFHEPDTNLFRVSIDAEIWSILAAP